MADRDLIEKKLIELKTHIKGLEELKKLSFEEIKSSVLRTWAVEHGLQLAIQQLIDIGNYILASTGDSRIESYIDVFDKLGANKIIPEDFAERIRGMAGFRNLLVHEYADLDLVQVYGVLQTKLDDFRQFIKYIKNYLDKI